MAIQGKKLIHIVIVLVENNYNILTLVYKYNEKQQVIHFSGKCTFFCKRHFIVHFPEIFIQVNTMNKKPVFQFSGKCTFFCKKHLIVHFPEKLHTGNTIMNPT